MDELAALLCSESIHVESRGKFVSSDLNVAFAATKGGNNFGSITIRMSHLEIELLHQIFEEEIHTEITEVVDLTIFVEVGEGAIGTLTFINLNLQILVRYVKNLTILL